TYFSWARFRAGSPTSSQQRCAAQAKSACRRWSRRGARCAPARWLHSSFLGGSPPGMGVAGPGLALPPLGGGSLLVLAIYMRSSHSPIRLAPARLQWRLFQDILRVGLPSAVGTIVANLSVVLTTPWHDRSGRQLLDERIAWLLEQSLLDRRRQL